VGECAPKGVKPTLQWAQETLRRLSQESYTGTVTIRFAQGGRARHDGESRIAAEAYEIAASQIDT
jgi:hypothetical protein